MTLIQLHILQSFSPNLLNRNREGMPKTVWFGGAQRVLISSQALKRAVRLSDALREALAGQALGVRTRRLPALLRPELQRLGASDADADATLARLHDLIRGGSKSNAAAEAEETDEESDPDILKQMVFLSQEEARWLAEEMWHVYQDDPEGWPALSTTKLSKRLGVSNIGMSLDMAAFGRMTTTTILPSIDAATQVAPAISTHRTDVNLDFWTAVDDLQPPEKTGSANMGESAFTAATMYRYVNIDLRQLRTNLRGDADSAREAAAALTRAFVQALPAASQNSRAAHQAPALVLLEVGRCAPLSYANAWERAARASAEMSVMDASVAALQRHMADLNTLYDRDDGSIRRAYIAQREYDLGELAERQERLSTMLGWLWAQFTDGADE